MMKLFYLLFVAILFYSYSNAQPLKKYPVGSSGCSVYMFCDPGEFEKTYSIDSSAVFTGECNPDSITYNIICVKLKEYVSPGQVAEDLLISYMDYLKTSFNIKSSAGYGKGHTLTGKPDVRGVIDYWNGQDGAEWKVKGWSDGKIIVVLSVMAKGKLEYSSKFDLFLNGFRFPGM